MPNPPRSKITIDDVNSQFYQLKQINFVISDGYRYRLDWEKYDLHVRRSYEHMLEVRRNLHDQSNLPETQMVDLSCNEQQYLEAAFPGMGVMINMVGNTRYVEFLEIDSERQYQERQYRERQYRERQHQYTEQDLRNAEEFYMEALEKCDIIDENGKNCGDYFTATKNYDIVYRRFVSNGNVYYRDEYNDLWTCGHSYVGHLKDDGITIDYDNLFIISRDAWE